jgi:hypothetical protein
MATGNSNAFYYLDTAAFGGGVSPVEGGFLWNLVAVYRERQTNRKNTVTGITAMTLDDDGIPQIHAKLAAAVKDEGVKRDFAVTAVAFNPITVMSV